LIAILASENENRLSFSEKVIEVHVVLKKRRRKNIKWINEWSERDLISSEIMKKLMCSLMQLNVFIYSLSWELVVNCWLDVNAYLFSCEMRSKLLNFTELFWISVLICLFMKHVVSDRRLLIWISLISSHWASTVEVVSF